MIDMLSALVKLRSLTKANVNNWIRAFVTNTNDLEYDDLLQRYEEALCLNKELRTKLAETSKANRPFVFKKSEKNDRKNIKCDTYCDLFRHVALHVAYLGWDWDGVNVQSSSSSTIEAALLDALEKSGLRGPSRDFRRCGRTDKGVSSSGQVFSLWLRTRADCGIGVWRFRDGNPVESMEGNEAEDFPFPLLLNRFLPRDVRVLAWSPAPWYFHAGKSCVARTYDYFFPENGLDQDALREVAEKLTGIHDFRNFCEPDVPRLVKRETGKEANQWTFFKRNLFQVDFAQASLPSLRQSPFSLRLCRLRFVGSSFLRHQIRRLVAIIFLVASKREAPTIVDELLDVDSTPAAPVYRQVKGFPLDLYECRYDGDFEWRWEEENLLELVRHYQSRYVELATTASIYAQILDSVVSRLDFNEKPAKVMKRPDAYRLMLEVTQKKLFVAKNEPWMFLVEKDLKQLLDPHEPLKKRKLRPPMEKRVSAHMLKNKT